MKKLILINTLSIFGLCFFTHFIYDFFPNNLFALFFPVNESIWEHMKMLFSTIMIYGVIEYIISIKFNYSTNNFVFLLFFKGILNIVLYLILFLPIYYIFGHNMIITISILFLSILLTEMIIYTLKQKKEIKFLNNLSFFLIILSFICFGYLTYYPLKNDLFFDHKEHKYGINIYVK